MLKNLPGWKGKKQVLDPPPPFPNRLAYLWALFNEFAWGLVANGMAPPMASWRDAEDFAASQLYPLTPFDKMMLVKLANIRANIQAQQSAEKMKTHGAQGPHRSG